MKLLQRVLSFTVASAVAFSLLSVSGFAEEKRVLLTCVTADEWTDLLYRPNQSETTWLGADGIFTVNLNGNDSFASSNKDTNTLFFFSDTFIGKSDENGIIYGDRTMPSHTAALLSGYAPDKDNIQFIYGEGGNMDPSQSLFGEYRWLFDSMVVGDSVYVLGFPEVNWTPTQVDMFRIPIEDGTPKFAEFEKTEAIPQLLHISEDGRKISAFGIGIMCNTKQAGALNPDGYIYIYGYRATTNNIGNHLIVSRIKESDFPDFSKLTYWDGEKWGDDIEECKSLFKYVSCEMSVTPITTGPYKGKYIAIYTKNTEGPEVCYSIGDTPYGPFKINATFYNCPEWQQPSADGVGWIYTYNAKAHPHLSREDKLLVTYNTNSRNPLSGQAADYHPRFLWLDLDPENDLSPDVDYSLPFESFMDPRSETFPVWIVVLAAVAFVGAGAGAFFIVKAKRKRSN